MRAPIIPEGWVISARMPAQDQDGWEAFYAFDAEHYHQYGRIYYFKPGEGPDVPVFPRDFMAKDKEAKMERTALEVLLGWAIEEAKRDRDDAAARGSSVDEIRSLANTVTKLREARMWHREAGSYYEWR